MAANLIFVPGRTTNSENPILNGFRFAYNNKKNDRVYWRCAEYKKGCTARITTIQKELTSSILVRNHDIKPADDKVYLAKQGLKRRAVETDLPTKYLIAEAVSGLGFESRAKVGCKISFLSRMVRRKREAASDHPANPKDLESLVIPRDYIISSDNECLMLWDSGYSPITRRSFLWGTPSNMDTLKAADHWIIDGTFKSAPDFSTQVFTVRGLYNDGWHFPLAYGLLPEKTQSLYHNMFLELDNWGPFQPKTILMGYELAIHNGVAEVFPSTVRRGCFFSL